MKVSITIKGDKELAKLLDGASRRALDLTPATSASASEAFSMMLGTFRAQSSPDGSKWEPLKESTLRRRKRGKEGTHKPLIGDTGQLRSTLFAEGSKTGVTMGSKATSAAGFPYWLSQLFGANIRRIGKKAGPYSIDIPARPFMPVAMVGGNLEVMASGKAANWYKRFIKRALTYITTGKVV